MLNPVIMLLFQNWGRHFGVEYRIPQITVGGTLANVRVNKEKIMTRRKTPYQLKEGQLSVIMESVLKMLLRQNWDRQFGIKMQNYFTSEGEK